MKFIVFEKANVNDTREPSFTSEKPLRETKRLAGTMVAFKKPGERWTEVDDCNEEGVNE